LEAFRIKVSALTTELTRLVDDVANAADQSGSRLEVHARLLERTRRLADRTAALALHTTPFRADEHTELRAALQRHQTDLRRHRARTTPSPGQSTQGQENRRHNKKR
jgi:hypothetical protein